MIANAALQVLQLEKIHVIIGPICADIGIMEWQRWYAGNRAISLRRTRKFAQPYVASEKGVLLQVVKAISTRMEECIHVKF
jgi:hypothetical protein